jgi:hypothetical protein
MKTRKERLVQKDQQRRAEKSVRKVVGLEQLVLDLLARVEELEKGKK